MRDAARARQKWASWVTDGASTAVLIGAILAFVFPLYWLVSMSLKTTLQTFALPPEWFFKPTFANYASVFHEQGTLLAVTNSLITSTVNTAIAVVIGSLGAYALARFAIPRKKDIWFWIISNRMIPPVVLAIPLFIMATATHLYDTRTLLVIIYLSFNLPLVVWIMVGFFQAIPKEVEEAAQVDGAGPWRTFFLVSMPLAMPGVAVAAMFSFMFAWNSFLMPFVLTESSARTLPVVAATYIAGFGVQWGQITAIGTLIVIPPLALSIWGSKYLIRGLTLGAMK